MIHFIKSSASDKTILYYLKMHTVQRATAKQEKNDHKCESWGYLQEGEQGLETGSGTRRALPGAGNILSLYLGQGGSYTGVCFIVVYYLHCLLYVYLNSLKKINRS